MNDDNDYLQASIMRKAIIAFQKNFIMYVEELDSDLHKRAMQFARDYSQFEFKHGDEEDEQEKE